MHPTVTDDVTIDVSEVGVTLVPGVTDMLQMLIYLNAVLDAGDPGSTASPMTSPGSGTWRTCTWSGRTYPSTDSAAATRPPRLRAAAEAASVPDRRRASRSTGMPT